LAARNKKRTRGCIIEIEKSQQPLILKSLIRRNNGVIIDIKKNEPGKILELAAETKKTDAGCIIVKKKGKK